MPVMRKRETDITFLLGVIYSICPSELLQQQSLLKLEQRESFRKILFFKIATQSCSLHSRGQVFSIFGVC